MLLALERLLATPAATNMLNKEKAVCSHPWLKSAVKYIQHVPHQTSSANFQAALKSFLPHYPVNS